jgi:hypothetical protein
MVRLEVPQWVEVSQTACQTTAETLIEVPKWAEFSSFLYRSPIEKKKIAYIWNLLQYKTTAWCMFILVSN